MANYGELAIVLLLIFLATQGNCFDDLFDERIKKYQKTRKSNVQELLDDERQFSDFNELPNGDRMYQYFTEASDGLKQEDTINDSRIRQTTQQYWPPYGQLHRQPSPDGDLNQRIPVFINNEQPQEMFTSRQSDEYLTALAKGYEMGLNECSAMNHRAGMYNDQPGLQMNAEGRGVLPGGMGVRQRRVRPTQRGMVPRVAGMRRNHQRQGMFSGLFGGLG